MFIKSMKFRKRILPAWIAAMGLVIVLAAAVMNGFKTAGDLAADEKSREEYVANLGWEIDRTTLKVKTVTIPQNFGDVYENYNEIQKKAGFDLTPYKGKKVQIFTYSVLNYPEKNEEVMLHLMVSDGKVIGGDVCSAAADGFMIPIK